MDPTKRLISKIYQFTVRCLVFLTRTLFSAGSALCSAIASSVCYFGRGIKNTPNIRLVTAVSFVLLSLSVVFLVWGISNYPISIKYAFTLASPGIFLFLFARILRREQVRADKQREIQSAEERSKREPENSNAAWDVARLNLQLYIDTNLSQVSWVFGIISSIMTSGFALIFMGVLMSWYRPGQLTSSLIAAGSGIITQFISATFIVIYEKTNEQAKDYVEMLERINAVGMSAQLLEGLEEVRSDLRDKSKVDLATELLYLYNSKKVSSRPLLDRSLER